MREIAYTTLGRNALAAGLISHVAALTSAMMSEAGANDFFSITYPSYWTVFILGVYTELKSRGCRPFGNWRFYLSAFTAVLPIAGPLTAFFMLYAVQGNRNAEPFKLWDMFTSMLRLRANILVLFVSIVILFVFFILTIRQHDTYFMKRGLL